MKTIQDVLNELDGGLDDFANGTYYERDPKRFNGTTKDDLKTFIRSEFTELIEQVKVSHIPGQWTGEQAFNKVEAIKKEILQ